MNLYPEHAKLEALNGANQTVGEFLDWLGESGMFIAEYGNGSQLMPVAMSREQLIAKHFDINQTRLDKEKREMLADFVRKTA
jgi:hypothetical protein